MKRGMNSDAVWVTYNEWPSMSARTTMSITHVYIHYLIMLCNSFLFFFLCLLTIHRIAFQGEINKIWTEKVEFIISDVFSSSARMGREKIVKIWMFTFELVRFSMRNGKILFREKSKRTKQKNGREIESRLLFQCSSYSDTFSAFA